MDSTRERLQRLIDQAPVVLFMKGTRAAPQCGFSASVVNLLDDWLEDYVTVDVITDPAAREGIKQLTDWPTIPQLFVAGKFIGGADIIQEMAQAGELAELFGATGPLAPPSPTITVTERAAAAFASATEGTDEGEHLRLEIDGEFNHGLFFGPPERGEVIVDAGALTLRMSRATARRAQGLKIDYVASANGEGGFSIKNPNEPARVKTLTVQELKALMDAQEPLVLLDVRTDDEMETARVAGAVALDARAKADLEDTPADTRLVFMCHHGVRSRAAAEHYIRAGFSNVWNVEGGIDAWSRLVDPSVPRY